jgi:hypothetical protein
MKTTFSILLLSATCLLANESTPNFERLADAIKRAENSKGYPYGIMVKFKHTTPRQACLNTIKSNWLKYSATINSESFISYLGKRYAPIGASNDRNNLNKNWIRNVTKFYNGK